MRTWSMAFAPNAVRVLPHIVGNGTKGDCEPPGSSDERERNEDPVGIP